MKTPTTIGPLRVEPRRKPVVQRAASNEPVEAPRMAEQFSNPKPAPTPTPPRANEGAPVEAPHMAERFKREGR